MPSFCGHLVKLWTVVQITSDGKGVLGVSHEWPRIIRSYANENRCSACLERDVAFEGRISISVQKRSSARRRVR